MMLRTLSFATALTLSTCVAAQQSDWAWHHDLESQVLDLVVRVPAKDGSMPSVTWQQPLEKNGVRYVRLQVGEFQGDHESDAELRVLREPLGELVASYRWKEMDAAGN